MCGSQAEKRIKAEFAGEHRSLKNRKAVSGNSLRHLIRIRNYCSHLCLIG